MKYADQSIAAFLENVASERVIPAGGSAAAVSGAVGASLCEMVCIHTVGAGDGVERANEETPDSEALTDVGDDLRRQRTRLLELADADATAVESLLSTAAEKSATGEKGETASAQRRATGVPLAIAETCLAVLENAAVVTEAGKSNTIPDAVTGAFLVRAALQSALFIVRSNVDGLEDRDFAEEVTGRAAEIEASAERTWERISKATSANAT